MCDRFGAGAAPAVTVQGLDRRPGHPPIAPAGDAPPGAMVLLRERARLRPRPA